MAIHLFLPIMKKSAFVFLFLLTGSILLSQEKWSLLKCYEYAIANNISIKQSALTEKSSQLVYEQSKKAQLPSLNFSGSLGYRLGRSENPTTGVLEDNNFLTNGYGLQTGVTLFNWSSLRNTTEANRLNALADKALTEKIKNDIALNIAVAYLQILLSKEQVNLAGVQVQTTREQLLNTRKRVAAGILPELNAAELEAQLARDSSAYVAAESVIIQYELQLKALLNLDAAVPFEVETPPVDRIPVLPLADMMPDAVYQLAIANLPQQKINDFRLQSAIKFSQAAKGQLYPTISMFGGLGSNYVRFKDRPVYNQVVTGYSPSLLRADAGGGVYLPVEVPSTTSGNTVLAYIKADSYGKQMKNNFAQNIGIGLSVPIFNGTAARTNWEQSKLRIKQIELTRDLDNQTLKQDIYRAYHNAVAALEKFNADKKSLETSAKAYSYAQKRYDLNLLTTLELITSQNNFQRAQYQALYSQYDYVFKMKLLEFYRGQGLKL
jgi:outer membrane protein